MTSKERMLLAMQNQKPDIVPVAPDVSNMIPCRLTGKPFWEIYLYNDPPLWKAYLNALQKFGFDGWFIYGHLDFKTDSKVTTESSIVSRDKERIVQHIVHHTPAGDLTEEITYPVADPPTPTVRRIKDIRKDIKKWLYFYPEIQGYDATILNEMKRKLGDRGVLGVHIGYPGFQDWFYWVERGVEPLAYTYADQPELLFELATIEERHLLKALEMILEAKPDFIILGGSGSITLQSPELFSTFSLPTIKKMTHMAREAGIPTMLHSCGKERALVEICVRETELDCVNPLEGPPMGDCDLAEVKEKFGDKIALMGNLNTTDIMLRGSVKDVESAVKKCIDTAGKGGGFILSTGDQCGRDTPDCNLRTMIETARIYGRYE